MTWYQILSIFLTNGLRIFFGMYLAITLLDLSGNMKKAAAFSACASVCITVLSGFPIQQIYIAGVETIILTVILYCLFAANLRMSLFLMFFYEITVALWEFIISAGLGVAFHSDSFLNTKSFGYMAAVWIVRFLMLGMAFLTKRTSATSSKKNNKQLSRVIAGIALAGFLGVVLLSGQNAITIGDDQLTVWVIFALLILVAVLFFNLNRQYEMEKTIAQLEKDKNALLERDYQNLRNSYAANAKLFHDFHNHVEALYRYLSKNSTEEAMEYLENLRTPMQNISQTAWIGEEAIDYLINSKIALAGSQNIRVNTNIEFPRHTNIRSVDLVAIIGNLLDNSIEAAGGAEGSLRFINLTIRRINDMLVIKVENGCSSQPAVANGILQTSKTDKALHGWGLKSVRTAAERYDGTIETEYSDHTFRAVVTLSFEAVKA